MGGEGGGIMEAVGEKGGAGEVEKPRTDLIGEVWVGRGGG